MAYRTCTAEGQWREKEPDTEAVTGTETGTNEGTGWTNYTACFTPDVRELLNQLYSGTQEEAQMKFLVAKGSKALEIIGLSLSLLSLLISLFIFTYFKFVDFRGPLAQPCFR
ncbi:hypothetical protein Pmani_008152 [Petrolisthes manimaculis]|uniref:Uncharacterized protein n=1 Tax=Petrolisthes manimaculis TaxID=1843537 RepID=A0AAE1Q766_9EUCA|nr:hypothetical protein Pmani_008152 [Petrolisthes manimaculis]